tara:strand:- start:1799 stop:2674 length:876 start_codon:yes stop_codon:yes gene_type:complete
MATTPYINGLTIKPNSVSTLGVVTFTDGTNNITPNQSQCEAYGYTYDIASGTCRSFRFNANLERNISNINNKFNGAGNSTQLGSNTIHINGTDNATRGFNNNCLINGNTNEIANGVSNAVVFGTNGIARTEGEFTIGGGKGSLSDADVATFISRRKTSTIELSGVTTGNTATNLTVQGDGSTYINIEANSIIGYDIYITRLELGGSAGTAGNYSYRNIRGAVKIDRLGVMSFVVGFNRNIAKIGINATCIMADSTTGGVPSISVNVQDRANVNNLWSASVTLHEVVSATTF